MLRPRLFVAAGASSSWSALEPWVIVQVLLLEFPFCSIPVLVSVFSGEYRQRRSVITYIALLIATRGTQNGSFRPVALKSLRHVARM